MTGKAGIKLTQAESKKLRQSWHALGITSSDRIVEMLFAVDWLRRYDPIEGVAMPFTFREQINADLLP